MYSSPSFRLAQVIRYSLLNPKSPSQIPTPTTQTHNPPRSGLWALQLIQRVRVVDQITAILHQVWAASHITANNLCAIRRGNANAEGPITTYIAPHSANRNPFSRIICCCFADRVIKVQEFHKDIRSRPARIGTRIKPKARHVVGEVNGKGILTGDGCKKVTSVVDSKLVQLPGIRLVYVSLRITWRIESADH
jgi:hypothetical protein